LATATVVLGTIALAELVIGSWDASRSARQPKTLLDHVHEYVDSRYHDCIPLGWYPERLPFGGYYLGLNLDVATNSGPFQALWVGIVPPGNARDPRVAEVASVMDQLVTAGLLTRTADDPRGERYNLTRYGQRFFFEDSDVTGNTEGWPYVCYSRLRVERLAWDTSRPDVPAGWGSVVKHVRLWWTVVTLDDWATPSLRSHSVRLRPETSPVDAAICRYVDGEWAIFPFASARERDDPTQAWANRAEARSGAGRPSTKPKNWPPC
jgi:hypothetical protein